jgi:hypothetical protein
VTEPHHIYADNGSKKLPLFYLNFTIAFWTYVFIFNKILQLVDDSNLYSSKNMTSDRYGDNI